MTAKYEKFIESLQKLCDEHGVEFSVVYEEVFIVDKGEGNINIKELFDDKTT